MVLPDRERWEGGLDEFLSRNMVRSIGCHSADGNSYKQHNKLADHTSQCPYIGCIQTDRETGARRKDLEEDLKEDSEEVLEKVLKKVLEDVLEDDLEKVLKKGSGGRRDVKGEERASAVPIA